MKGWKAIVLIMALSLLPAVGTEAQDFPKGPVSYMNPFNPGGEVDIAARAMQPYLEKNLAQPFVINYVPGAGGGLCWSKLTAAKPDGYTIGGFSIPHIILQPMFMKDVTYKTLHASESWEHAEVARRINRLNGKFIMERTQSHYDRIASLFFLIVGAFFALYSCTIEIGEWHEPGPGFLPFWAGITLVLMSIGLLASNWSRKGPARPSFFPETDSWFKAKMEAAGFVPQVMGIEASHKFLEAEALVIKQLAQEFDLKKQ